ncbi:MAG: tetratricopeptide repeat protein [Spirochaetes bacterium]|nr:tetratricopeptide repeat protein [Spirochaetota bacterium]
MARKPRYRTEQGAGDIQIQRNVIERFLMQVKEFVKKNQRAVLIGVLGLLGVIVIVVVGLIVADGIRSRNEARFEKIMDDYNRIAPSGDNKKIEAAVNDLKQFIESSRIGPGRSLGYYALGDILHARKEYKDAARNFILYADCNGKTVLAPLALLKAAISLEEAADLKGALGVYRRLEGRYSDSIVADQIYFHFARVCALTGDLFNAKAHYHKVINTYPESTFAQRARKRLFMLGAR